MNERVAWNVDGQRDIRAAFHVLEGTGGHEVTVERDDLIGRAVGGHVVVVDAYDAVEVRKELEIVGNDDELLLKLGKLALDAVTVAQIE